MIVEIDKYQTGGIKMKKVDLYAKNVNNEWVLIFNDINEDEALKIWEAGFKTGENRFSIEDDESRRISEMNRRAMNKGGLKK